MCRVRASGDEGRIGTGRRGEGSGRFGGFLSCSRRLVSRLVLLIALCFVCLGPAAAQASLMPEGVTGASLVAGTTFRDEVADVNGGLTFAPHPAVDVFVTGSRAWDDDDDALVGLGGGVTYYTDRDGLSRAGVSLSAQRSFGDGFRSVTAGTVSATVTRQAVVEDGLMVAPQLTLAVVYLKPDERAGGFRTAVAARVPFMLDLPRSRPFIAPSVTLDSETTRLGIGLTAGIVLFSSR